MPSRQDYQEALQAPEIAFADRELKGGSPVCDSRLGLPRAFSGQNATVFQLRAGAKTWAVKCFARELPDQQQRYAAISAHLQRNRLPYNVGFEFLPRGINVGGSWHPVLKMEWVDGEALKAYLERNLRNPAVLRDLAERFLEMVRQLQAAGIAHGDLQHGNVFVCGRDLRLVDYDGMFVPALAGLPSAELGHPNYQHPDRAATLFSNRLDNFSAWVIFLSLYALSVAPDLWDQAGRLDECLLFRKEDFRAPYASPVIQALAKSTDSTLQHLTLRFQLLLYSTPAEAVLPDVSWMRPTPAASTGAPWIDDHQRRPGPAGPGSSVSVPQPAPRPDSSWVLGWIRKPARPAGFRASVMPERLTALGSLMGGGTLVLARDMAFVDGYLAAYLLTLTLANLAVLRKRYGAEPDVRRLKKLSEQDALIGRQSKVRMNTVEATQKERAQRERRRADEIGRLRIQETVLRTREMDETNQVYVARDKRLQELATKRARLDLEEVQELSRARQPIQGRIQVLDQKLATLRAAESDELSKALRKLQAQHVLNFLRRHPIEHASVSGVGVKKTQALRLGGVLTAAEIEYYRIIHVKGIGPTLATGLVNWRSTIERGGVNTMPTALPHSEETAIRQRYGTQVQATTAQRNREAQEIPGQEQAIKAKYAALRADIPKEEDAARKAADANVRNTHGLYAVQHRALAETVRGVEAATAESVKEVEDRLVKLQKDLASLQWRKETLRLEMDQMAAVTLSKYLRRVFVGA